MQIDSRTRAKPARLNAGPREAYADVLNELVPLIPEGDGAGRFTDVLRLRLLEAELDAEPGRAITPAARKRRQDR